jgi:predicted DCC family thiol-disulfide oxidoreductase YuxK
MSGDPDGHDVVFYDGVCGLCNRFVSFLIARDRGARLRFATLQGEVARRLLVPLGGRPDDLDTVYVLRSDGTLLKRSRAILQALAALGGPWRLVKVLRLVPAPVADVAYGLMARVRYRLFGRLDACPLPPPEVRHRFVAASLD